MKVDEIENGGVYVGHAGDRRFVDDVQLITSMGDVYVSFMTEDDGGAVRMQPISQFAAWAKAPAPNEMSRLAA